MQSKYALLQEKEQDPQQAWQEIAQDLAVFLFPLLSVLDTLLAKRLVRTLVQCCVAIMRFRKTKQGLLLSELGSSMDGERGLATTATAGTKRRRTLLRSLQWSMLQIDRSLLEEAEKEVRTLKEQGTRMVCIWDGRVIAKPERSKLEGLCPLVSRKAKRLNRSRRSAGEKRCEAMGRDAASHL